jgi:sulfur carrier protein ThiS
LVYSGLWQRRASRPETQTDGQAVNDTAITVSLKLFGDLRKHGPRGGQEIRSLLLPAGATIADVVTRLGIGLDEEVIAGVNGEQATPETALNDGDSVMLVSPMEGG